MLTELPEGDRLARAVAILADAVTCRRAALQRGDERDAEANRLLEVRACFAASVAALGGVDVPAPAPPTEAGPS